MSPDRNSDECESGSQPSCNRREQPLCLSLASAMDHRIVGVAGKWTLRILPLHRPFQTETLPFPRALHDRKSLYWKYNIMG